MSQKQTDQILIVCWHKYLMLELKEIPDSNLVNSLLKCNKILIHSNLLETFHTVIDKMKEVKMVTILLTLRILYYQDHPLSLVLEVIQEAFNSTNHPLCHLNNNFK